MWEQFISVTDEYGVPSRLRSDYWGENIQVRWFMEEVRGKSRSAFIAGSSMHNTCIEHLEMYILQ